MRKSTYKELRKKSGTTIPLRILSAETLPAMKNTFLTYVDEEQNPGEGNENDRQVEDPVHSIAPLKSKKSFKERCSNFFHIKPRSKSLPVSLPDPYFDGVVLHIHGGGFVAMSSCSHQTYTRQWAKQVGKAVLSIDYRLAPKYPYPTALDDCWQAYNWILNEMEKSIGIKPSRIVLTGDSAGGNLALALTFLAIKNGVRIPNGLMLAYPALRVDLNAFTPSYLIALHDHILPHSVLKLIPGAYIPEGGRPKEDPLLSPIYASDELLEKLPPIRMMVGEKDPLHDDCWRLVDRLKKLNKDIKMTVYKDLSHGFLGYDMPGGIRMAKVCIQEAADMIKELLEK